MLFVGRHSRTLVNIRHIPIHIRNGSPDNGSLPKCGERKTLLQKGTFVIVKANFAIVSSFYMFTSAVVILRALNSIFAATRYDDITVREYEHYRRGVNGHACGRAWSHATCYLFVLSLVGMIALPPCGLSLHKAQDVLPAEESYDEFKKKWYYISCETMAYVYFLWAICGIVTGAITTLPVLLLDCAPVPSCLLRLHGKGHLVGCVNLGDIKNAKAAGSYILAKKRQLLGTRPTSITMSLPWTQMGYMKVAGGGLLLTWVLGGIMYAVVR